MKMFANPSAFGFGSASIHSRSSPAICADVGFGGLHVWPPSVDLPTVRLASVRLENAIVLPVPGTAGAICFGPSAQSQSPPPIVPSGEPRDFHVDPSCEMRNALHPAGTPIGAITYDRPYWSVRMLGSAVSLLPGSSRLRLNVPASGTAATACDDACAVATCALAGANAAASAAA